MTPSRGAIGSPVIRSVLLGLGFLLLVGIGVVTVVLPELAEEPATEKGAEEETERD